MKWILITASILFFSGCSTISSYERPGGYVVTGFDFTPFVEKGFYFSPNSYNGKFITMGTLDIIYLSEVKLSDLGEYFNPPDGWTVYERSNLLLKQKKVSEKELLDKMYMEAVKLKGNGIIDFKLDWVYNSTNWTYDARFTGTVIKILD